MCESGPQARHEEVSHRSLPGFRGRLRRASARLRFDGVRGHLVDHPRQRFHRLSDSAERHGDLAANHEVPHWAQHPQVQNLRICIPGTPTGCERTGQIRGNGALALCGSMVCLVRSGCSPPRIGVLPADQIPWPHARVAGAAQRGACLVRCEVRTSCPVPESSRRVARPFSSIVCAGRRIEGLAGAAASPRCLVVARIRPVSGAAGRIAWSRLPISSRPFSTLSPVARTTWRG